MWVKATRIVVTLMVGRRLCCFAVRYKSGVSWVAVAHRSPLSPILGDGCMLMVELPGKRKWGRPKRRFTDVFKEDMAEVEVTEEDTECRNNLFFLWFPCVGMRLVYWSLRSTATFVINFASIDIFSPLFFLLCLSQISLHAILPS